MHPQGLGGARVLEVEVEPRPVWGGMTWQSLTPPLIFTLFLLLLGRKAVLHPSTLLLLLSGREARRL